jgi:hypothetical protein
MEQDATIMANDDDAQRRKWRNISIALVLAALVVIFYTVTIVRIGGNIAERVN